MLCRTLSVFGGRKEETLNLSRSIIAHLLNEGVVSWGGRACKLCPLQVYNSCNKGLLQGPRKRDAEVDSSLLQFRRDHRIYSRSNHGCTRVHVFLHILRSTIDIKVNPWGGNSGLKYWDFRGSIRPQWAQWCLAFFRPRAYQCI